MCYSLKSVKSEAEEIPNRGDKMHYCTAISVASSKIINHCFGPTACIGYLIYNASAYSSDQHSLFARPIFASIVACHLHKRASPNGRLDQWAVIPVRLVNVSFGVIFSNAYFL